MIIYFNEMSINTFIKKQKHLNKYLVTIALFILFQQLVLKMCTINVLLYLFTTL